LKPEDVSTFSSADLNVYNEMPFRHVKSFITLPELGALPAELQQGSCAPSSGRFLQRFLQYKRRRKKA